MELDANIFRIFMSLWYLPLVKISKKSMRKGWHARDELTWNYPMTHLLLLATVTMINIKMSFTHFHSSSFQVFRETYFSIKIMQSISPNYTWENGVKGCWRKIVTKLYLVSIAKDKDPSFKVKMHQTFFFIFTSLSRCDLFSMSCLS